MVDHDPVREVTRADVAALAAGCAVFGTGGGGPVHIERLATEAALDEHGPVRLISVAGLTDDDAAIVLSGVGSPSVGVEMLGAKGQPATVVREVERLIGRPVTAVMPAEIGGSNGVSAVRWAAELGLTVLDADGMGRAFPEATMIAMNVAGLVSEFCVLADMIGNVAVLRTVDLAWLERQARAMIVASGSVTLGAHYVMTSRNAPGAVIEGTVGRALRVGRALLAADDPVAALCTALGAGLLITGKVVDVERTATDGFTRGAMTVDGVGTDRGRRLRVELQNENLVALDEGEVVASVPDLIAVVDTETGTAISTEMLRFGQRVSVLAWPCDPLWRTPRGLELAGPAAFGYHLPYVPLAGTGR
ncbi:DUF917 domain-containing protein [Actinoplanes sp. NPDC051851]|uniref:DUF917 domain-containing protein n=1 Tax=Actinoplanes sp. NPDC051851 TaxID=3154753 RepID=UPI003438092C